MNVVRDDFFPAHAVHKPKPKERIWRAPVKAVVTFNPQTGDWDAKGE